MRKFYRYAQLILVLIIVFVGAGSVQKADAKQEGVCSLNSYSQVPEELTLFPMETTMHEDLDLQSGDKSLEIRFSESLDLVWVHTDSLYDGYAYRDEGYLHMNESETVQQWLHLDLGYNLRFWDNQIEAKPQNTSSK